MSPTALTNSELSVRAFTRLRDAGVADLTELQEWTTRRLMQLRGFGRGCLEEVEAALKAHGMGLRHHLTPAEHEEIRVRFAAGASARSLAAEYGVSVSSIRSHCRGITTRAPRYNPRAKLTPAQRQELIRRRANGEAATTLAAEFGVSRPYVCLLAPPPPKQPVVPDSLRHLRRRIEEAFLDTAAAGALLQIDKSTLCEALRRGRFPGAFKFGRAEVWLIPRAAIEEYGRTRRRKAG